MLVFNKLYHHCKYYMRLMITFIIFVFYGFWMVPVTWAQAVTLMNAVEGELYTEVSHPQLYCLAKNIYFESKSEPIAGQYAVADVVLNRVKDTRFPNTICEVVYEGPVRESWKTKQDPDLSESERIYNPIRHMCQFSWYCDGKKDEPEGDAAWDESVYLALLIYSEEFAIDVTEGALWYHATYVSPNWAEHYEKTVRINEHIFYR